MSIIMPNEGLYLLKPLFAAHSDTLVDCVLSGEHGTYAIVDDANSPTSAMLMNDVFGIAAGDPEFAYEHLKFYRRHSDNKMVILIPENSEWEMAFLESGAPKQRCFTRFAFNRKTFTAEDIERLAQLARLPEGVEVTAPTAEHLSVIMQDDDWQEDFLGPYNAKEGSPDIEGFLSSGLPLVLLENGRPAATCSGAWRYLGGVEIQINTHADFRQKGYATIVAARFMLNALSKGITPSWDAANLVSVKLARRLGYEYKRSYIAWHLEWR